MQEAPEHPLLTKRMEGATAVLALSSGIGLALMSFDLTTVGLIISALGAVGAMSIYWSDFKRLRLRLAVPHGTTPIAKEVVIVIVALAIGLGAPTYVFVQKNWPILPVERHLTANQKTRMQADLKLSAGEHYQFQINSVPSCDECELYAIELRKFFNKIPGLQAGGGPLIFPAQYGPGIQFVTNGKEPQGSAAMRVSAALRDAGIELTPETEIQMKKGDFIVLVGRQPH